jgi:hypothetical protein
MNVLLVLILINVLLVLEIIILTPPYLSVSRFVLQDSLLIFSPLFVKVAQALVCNVQKDLINARVALEIG